MVALMSREGPCGVLELLPDRLPRRGRHRAGLSPVFEYRDGPRDHRDDILTSWIQKLPRRERTTRDRNRHGDAKPIPKLVVKLSHEDGGVLVIISDQKFLVEKVEDEDVMELTFPVQGP